MVLTIQQELERLANPQKANILQRFFKTDKGQYGEGDIFLGITVPQQRILAKKYVNLSLKEISILLKSKIHEHRLTALLILVQKYTKTTDKKAIVDFYLHHTAHINNWDLVDLTAEKILGDYYTDKDKKILYKFATSKNLWERRIAIISTFAFIKKSQFTDTINICELLLQDKHDLMHKACGWMLREMGKRDEKPLRTFLEKYSSTMPRTMLRYSLEKFDEKTRKKYLLKL